MKPVDVQLEQARADNDRAESNVTDERRGLALCLSGGGYRAALFHLGALVRLHETGLLARMELISSVSGGSIVSAWLATRYLATRRDADESFERWCIRIDFRDIVVEPFRRIVGRDIRTWPVLRTFAYNWLWPSHRVRLLERAYAKHFGDAAIADLPDTPAFVFCASDLTFGVNWVFSKERVGDYMAGYLRAPRRIPLSEAVAASSSFPPVFGPVRFAAGADDFKGGNYRQQDRDRLRAQIDLSDGGVYDNLAMEPALRRYATVLVSDAGAPFQFETRRWYFKRLLRYTEVIGNQARSLRKRIYYTLQRRGTFDGVLWELTGSPDGSTRGYDPSLVAEVIGRIRTDLDRFIDPEFEVLVNHGYFSCSDAIQGKQFMPAYSPDPDWVFPTMADQELVRRALRRSYARVLHGRWFTEN